MTVSDAEAIQAAAQAAIAVVKRGLGERGQLDVKMEEIHLLTVLQLARSSEVDEGLQVVYKLFDVLDDAGCLQLPTETAMVEREGALQGLCATLNESAAVKSQKNALMQLSRSLLRHSPLQSLSFATQLSPLQLWKNTWNASNPQPTRKRKPPPPEPENVWHFLCPERAPSAVPRNQLSKLFKRWMLTNHPDKGGDESICAKVSAANSTAMAKGLNATGANPNDEEFQKVDEDVVYRQQQNIAEP